MLTSEELKEVEALDFLVRNIGYHTRKLVMMKQHPSEVIHHLDRITKHRLEIETHIEALKKGTG